MAAAAQPERGPRALPDAAIGFVLVLRGRRGAGDDRERCSTSAPKPAGHCGHLVDKSDQNVRHVRR